MDGVAFWWVGWGGILQHSEVSSCSPKVASLLMKAGTGVDLLITLGDVDCVRQREGMLAFCRQGLVMFRALGQLL